MLSSDLAVLYGVKTKELNKAVQRNLERFPDDFMFQLTTQENEFLRFQIGTLEKGRGKYSKYLPYAFTEQGVSMLSTVLNSKRAILVNIEIIRAFVRLRQVLATHKDLAQKLEALEKRVGAQDAKIQAVFDAIRELMKAPEKPKRKIGFLEEPKAIYRTK
jgi:phage regulator Rha-like protein